MITHSSPQRRERGFTLLEMMVVMSIIVLLLSLGAVGIGRMSESQKANTALSLVEALVEEARQTAIGNNTRARLAIYDDTGNMDRHLRYFAILQEDPTNGTWELSSRGTTLPKGVYFDPTLSGLPHANTIAGQIGTYGAGASIDFPGETGSPYHYYEFNSQGICIDGGAAGTPANGTLPGAALVLVQGVMPPGDANPTVKGKDGVGFVILRNGSTARIRNIDDIFPSS